MLINVSTFCFLASYLVVLVLEFSRLLGRNWVSRLVSLGFASAGLLAHSLFLISHSRQANLPPLLSSTRDWLLVLAWLLVVLYVYFAIMHQELALGAFVLPLVLVLVASSYFVSDTPISLNDAEGVSHRAWGMLHASCLVLGMLGVAAGFLAGLMYLVQHRRLKTKHLSATGWEMPSLAKLAQVTRWSVMAAFPLLTLGFASGVLLGLRKPMTAGQIRLDDPFILVSGAVWLIMAITFLKLMLNRTPQGRQLAWLTICSLGFLLVTLVSLQVLTGNRLKKIESWHSQRIPGVAPSKGGPAFEVLG